MKNLQQECISNFLKDWRVENFYSSALIYLNFCQCLFCLHYFSQTCFYSKYVNLQQMFTEDREGKTKRWNFC